MRGTSLVPLLHGDEPKEWRDHVYYSYQHTGRCIRTRKYKYAMRYEFSRHISTPPSKLDVVDKPFVLKEGGASARFIPGEGGRFVKESNTLLFDLENDPWETRNLAENPEYSSVVKEHENLLENWEEKLAIGTRFDRN